LGNRLSWSDAGGLGEGNMATRADGLETMWCRRREMGRILPNGAGADTIGAVITKCPSGALHPGVSGDERKR